MSYVHYKVVGKIDGEVEVLYSSYLRKDCAYEMKYTQDYWKDEGYKSIKIDSINTDEAPDPEVYKDEIITTRQLWMNEAPRFNFELDEKELLEKALESGFVYKLEGNNDLYFLNKHYQGL